MSVESDLNQVAINLKVSKSSKEGFFETFYFMIMEALVGCYFAGLALDRVL